MKVLIIVGFFGADKTVGAKRMNSLATYLVRHGNEVTVMTTSKSYDMPKEFKNIEFCFVDEAPLAGSPMKNEKIFRLNRVKFENEYLRNISYINPDIILISGSPFYTFSITKLAKEKDIPCVLDFRDPWIFDFRGLKNTFSIRKNLYRMIHYSHERSAIANASAAVMVTKGWCDDYKRLYSKYRNKFFVVENGYDEQELDNIDVIDPDERVEEIEGFKIGVFGKLAYYSENNTRLFFQGIKTIHDESIHIVQIGEREKIVDSIINQFGMNADRIISTGFMDYKKGMATLKTLDALLIIDNRMHALGTKIYDYIYVNKPIIYIGPKDSDMANLVGRFEYGFICSKKFEIEETILKLIEQKPNKLQDGSDAYDYSRNRQNEKYMELLSSLS